jgi:hypothetical protein
VFEVGLLFMSTVDNECPGGNNSGNIARRKAKYRNSAKEETASLPLVPEIIFCPFSGCDTFVQHSLPCLHLAI